MLLPAIATKTFSKLKGDLYYRKIFNKVTKSLKKISNPIKRAKLFHLQVDEQMSDLLEDESVKKLITCKAGCSGCCYTQVSVTRDESKLLAERVVEGLHIDLGRLFDQASVENNAKDWYTLPHSERGCIFLDKDEKCTVYEDRPAVCRTNNVLSPAALCDTSDGKEKPVRLLNTYEADMAIYGAFSNSKENGALPYMLWKALKQMGHTNSKTLPKSKAKSIFNVNEDA